MSPAASAATSNAVRPRLNTASVNGTDAARARRATASVDVVASGIHTTTLGSKGSGTRTAWPPADATTPPKIDGAALSAWPSSAVATCSSSSAASSGWN